MSVNSEQSLECPLCLELLEMDDINFFPCTCGYQICRFCWHRIRTNENGLCPACRKQYPEDPANFKPLTAEELQQIKNEKRQKDLQRKQKISENRKHLANVRVVQKNLVFVVGLPTRLADAEELRKQVYFGKFGKILKVIVNHSTSYAGSQGPSASAYVTYQKGEDALRAIQAVNNSKVDGRTLKASLGTTKYCSHFLKKLQCPKQDCMYLHELGDDSASFTKEEMQAGKHQEYEHKLYEQMISNCSQNSSRKQLSPAEQLDPTQFLQKERWPSPPKKEEHRSNGLPESSGYLQPIQNNLKASFEPTLAFKLKHTSDEEHIACSHEQLASRDIPRHLMSQQNVVRREEILQTEVQHTNTNCSTSEPNSRHSVVRDAPVNCISNNGSYPNVHYTNSQSALNTQSLENHTALRKPEMNSQKFNPILSEPQLDSMNISLHQYRSKSPVLHPPGLPNGFSHNSQLKTLTQIPPEWIESHSKDFLKYKLLDTSPHSTGYSSDHQETNCTNSVFISERNTTIPLNRFHSSGVHSAHGASSNTHNGLIMPSENCMKHSYPASENSSCDGQDDDLGFDPWHESSKGLADLMIKEAGESARFSCVPQNKASANIFRRTAMPSEQLPVSNHNLENPRYTPRQTVPPPGFSLSNYGANSSMPRPSVLVDGFPNKVLPLINTYNLPTSAQMTQFQQHQGLHTQIGSSNNILNMTEGGMRPQMREWHENHANITQNTGEHRNFGSMGQCLPMPMGRAAPPLMWNDTPQTELQMLTPEHAELQRYAENGPSHMGKMFQQVKTPEQAARAQNHTKYNTYAQFRDYSF